MSVWVVCPPAVSPESSVMAVVDSAITTNGSTVSFTCDTDGGPENVFVWIMVEDSVDLGTFALFSLLNVSEVVEFLQSTYTVLQEGSNDEYVIDSVNATENGGTYTCVVVNVAGFDSDEVELLVQPTITRQPESVLTFQGDNISLSCEADGFPPPSYSWFRQTVQGDVEMNSGGNDTLFSGNMYYDSGSTKEEFIFSGDEPQLILNNGGRDLFIYGVDFSDAGSYFCRASSSVGFVDSRPATVTGAFYFYWLRSPL